MIYKWNEIYWTTVVKNGDNCHESFGHKTAHEKSFEKQGLYILLLNEDE